MSLKLTRRKGSEFWWITGTIDGRRIRESTRRTNRREAQEILTKRGGVLHRAAVFGEEAVVTWADAVASYAQVQTIQAGMEALLDRLSRHFGEMHLRSINQLAVDRAILTLCRPDAAPGTKLRNVIVPLQAVLNHAARRGWCQPPAFEKPRGASGAKRTRWLTPPEFIALRDAAAPHLRPLIVFLACTGARLGSALALDWADVDLQHGRALLRDTKNGNDHTVELLPATVAAMAMMEGRVGRVFRTDDGGIYPPSDDGGGQIRTAWATACRRAGFAGSWKGDGKSRWWTPADVTPHVLRHTWASWRYAFHRDILRLKAEGDWSSVALCERYAKLVPAGMLADVLAAWGLPQSGTSLTQCEQGAA